MTASIGSEWLILPWLQKCTPTLQPPLLSSAAAETALSLLPGHIPPSPGTALSWVQFEVFPPILWVDLTHGHKCAYTCNYAHTYSHTHVHMHAHTMHEYT